MNIKIICSDCDGVLANVDHDYSKSGYYVNKDNVKIHDGINKFMFQSKYLVKSWMVNEITYREINKIMADRLNISENKLNDILRQSIEKMEWNWDLINLYQKYRKNGVNVVITTDNMDIFTEIAVPYHKFDTYFDKIYNSADMGILKLENNLQFFKGISKEFNLPPNEILIIDDNKEIIEKANGFGYKTYLYNMDTYNNFEKWFGKTEYCA